MNTSWLPWLKLAGVWVTTVLLCLVALVVLVYQTSGPMGRRGQIEKQSEELSREVARLERAVGLAAEERVVVAETGAEIDRIAGEIFGSLKERLTAVLREVGLLARNAGLIPEGFSYQLRRQESSGGMRFGISFSVEGRYSQVRQLLAGLQGSPQFLIIDRISFKGEEDPRSQNLAIGLQVSTFLADAEPEELRELIDLLQIDAVVLEEAQHETAPDVIDGDGEETSPEGEVTPEEAAVQDLSDLRALEPAGAEPAQEAP